MNNLEFNLIFRSNGVTKYAHFDCGSLKAPTKWMIEEARKEVGNGLKYIGYTII
jgi:hypothetical protein